MYVTEDTCTPLQRLRALATRPAGSRALLAGAVRLPVDLLDAHRRLPL